MSGWRGLALAALLGVLAVSAALAAPSVPATADAVRAAPLRVPRPDLGTMEDAVQRKVGAAQAAVERLLASPGAPPGALADAFGTLGQLFHAFRLLDAAEACYESALGLTPDDFRWSYYRGLVRYAQGELAAALADFEAALELVADDRAALLRAGTTLLELDRAAEARARFERALAAGGASAAALYGLGKAAALAGDDAAAAELFERALALEPRASVIHYPLGQAYRRLGELDKAMEHLRQRGEEEPSFPDPLGTQLARLAKSTAFEIVLALARDRQGVTDRDFLGFALSQFADVEGAIEQLRYGLAQLGDTDEPEANPAERARIHYVLGALLVNAGRDEPAMTQFRSAAELDPELLDARIKLGNALSRRDLWADAVGEYTGVLGLQPEHQDALLKRAAALMTMGRDTEARADLERLLEIAPELPEARIRLAIVLERLGDLEGAAGSYREAAKLELPNRELAQVRTGLAWLLAQRGDLEEALELYREALAVEPGSVPALAGLAGLEARRGRFAAAAELYRQWAEQETANPVPALARARALIFAGDYAAAGAALEAGVARFPEVVDFKDVLARHLAACPDRSQRDGRRALELAQAVYERLQTPESVETVAMAHAEVGQVEEAVRWQERLIEQLGADADPRNLARLRRNLETYRRGEPCCAPPGG